MTTLPDSPTMTAKQLAHVLGLSENTLYRHVKNGTAAVEPLPSGGRIMFRTTDVARLLGLVETPAPTDLDVVVERLDEAVHLLRIIAAALSRPTLGRVS